MKRLLSVPRVATSLLVTLFTLLIAAALWNRSIEHQFLMVALLALTMLGALSMRPWYGAAGTTLLAMTLYGISIFLDDATNILAIIHGVGFVVLLIAGLGGWFFSRQVDVLDEDMQRQNTLIDALTIYDQQSGALRHAHAVEVLEYEVARARRYQDALTLAVVELDVSSISHGTVQDARRTLSAYFITKLRTVDRVGMGARNECLLILPNTGLQQADIVAGRLIQLVHEQLAMTILIGLASFPQDGSSSEQLLNEARSAVEFGRLNSIAVVSTRLIGAGMP